jgi:hypothetical protein
MERIVRRSYGDCKIPAFGPLCFEAAIGEYPTMSTPEEHPDRDGNGERVVGMAEFMRRLNVRSRTTMYEYMDDGVIVEPPKIAGKLSWRASYVNEVVEKLTAAEPNHVKYKERDRPLPAPSSHKNRSRRRKRRKRPSLK